MKKNEETDYNEAMVKLTLENNALLKTILHYIEKMEAHRLQVDIETVEAGTDEIINGNLQQAIEMLNQSDSKD